MAPDEERPSPHPKTNPQADLDDKDSFSEVQLHIHPKGAAMKRLFKVLLVLVVLLISPKIPRSHACFGKPVGQILQPMHHDVDHA